MKKTGIKLLLGIFTFITIGGSLLYVKPAKAFGGAELLYAWNVAKSFLKDAAVPLAMRSFSYFLRRVSYDTAVWLASGGKGQSPLAQYKDFKSYMKDVGDNAAGVAIDALGTKWGLNLCKIPDPKIDLAMRIGLTHKFLDEGAGLNTQTEAEGVRKPDCTLTQFNENVIQKANYASKFGSIDDVAKKFNVAFTVEQSDVGILMAATAKVDNLVRQEVEAQKLQRQEGGSYKRVEEKISGGLLIPPEIVAKEAESKAPSEERKAAEAGFLSVVGTDAVGSFVSAGSLFLNTLGSQMLKNFQTKGMFPFGICVEGRGGASCSNKLQDTLTNLEGQASRGGRLAAQALFSELLTPPNLLTDQYNVLLNFTNCPSNPSPDNCVADAGLAQAAQESNSDKSITIADALEKNWLHGEWKLISPDRLADNTDPTCHQRAYCYANIAKLRKARVLPLGFEIAALNSNPDKPWTLKQIVDGFNDCNFIKDVNGKVVGVDNDPVRKPFCHLIDPNWVIKAPPSKCNFMAFGTSPSTFGEPNRSQECVDMTTCVAYDKDGNCATQGYCTREKNVWKIDAAKCDAENRTCRTFQDSTGQNVSYLYRTLDTGYCTQATIGCSQYSLKQNNAGNWAAYSRGDLNLGENSVIHFNDKVSTNCSANSDGCSSFKVVENSDQLYLKKAPYYLGCYDTDRNTPAIDWPQSASDLNRLTPTTTCNNYAQPCIADEVSCNWYSPISYAGDNIPGKFTPAKISEDGIVWNDQCDKKCVGYAAYREMPSNYANGQSIDYIIPSSGSRCNAVDESCSSFTNLATTQGGLEKVDYFSYLRPCILPDPAKQKTFYTYEGSEVGGFQLKGFVLEKDPEDGSPKYFYRTAEDLASYDNICSESLYKQGLASPDCRQFNDEKGVVYYKLLSKTVAVAQSCTPYRLNDTELYAINLNESRCTEQKGKWDGSSCQVCFQNGEYRDGQCFYYGLPGGTPNTAGMSKTCPVSANTCRAYKGNAGNNVRNIFSDNFEGANALNGWEPIMDINQSLESTHNGEHSLSYNGNEGVYKNVTITPGQSYDIIFWAKGSVSAEDVTVTLESGVVGGINAASSDNLGIVSVSDVWQSYHLGPVSFSGSTTTARLKFSLNGKLFLDNIHLKEVADYLYLVKNSLKVDPICDSNINDNLPGEALGCSQYNNPDNQPLYLTKFTSLCREKAIGCTALYDTRNTPDETGSRTYNVWLSGVSGQKITKKISGRDYSCQIALGQIGCYVDIVGGDLGSIVDDGGVIVTSTIYIQPDTTSSVYLVANKEATCNAVDLGCTKAGKLTQTLSGPTYNTVLIKQDPTRYSSTLCQSEAVGCNAYNSSDGVLYFKDPSTIGQKICAYRDNVLFPSGVSYKGWFWKGVGKCTDNDNFCTSDTDCSAGATCGKKDEQPCYPEYLQSGNNYGLWSYGVTNTYKNFVGECPSTQSGCTEFIDHNENNKPYYIISDDRLKSNQTECNGEVSEKAGCILMERTDQPNKLWNSAASYAFSVNSNNNLVKPVVSTTNDANVILKVNRDRDCGEWLQCRSSHRVFDQQLGTYKEICDDIGRCNKAGEGTEGGIINCANWLDGNYELGNQPLTDEIYRDRSTDWKGQDFSGFSLLNVFPIEELSEINVGTGLSSQWRLAKPLACGGDAGQNCKQNTGINSSACAIPGNACGRGGVGICLGATNPVCIQNFDGSTNNANTQFIKSSCRAYPEETSPFPNTESIGKSLPYSSVNFCNEAGGRLANDESKAFSCDCNYTKALYGDSTVKYWNFSKPNEDGIVNKNSVLVRGVVSGLCLGGENEGKVCTSDGDCTNGSCQKKKSESRLIGWQGYCVEPDLSRPLNAEQNKFACLTWFPKDNIFGSFDINNQHVEAGFQAATAGGKYYCLKAKGNQQLLDPQNNTMTYDKLLSNKILSHNNSLIFNQLGGLCSNDSFPQGCAGNCAAADCEHDSGGDSGTDREKRVISVGGDPIFRDEIDYIKIEVSGNGNWFPNNRTSFFIRNGLKTKYDGSQWSVEGKESPPAKKLNGENGLPLGRYVSSDGTDSKYWFMRYDDGEGDGDDQFQFADPKGEDNLGAPFTDLLAFNNDGANAGVCKNIDKPGEDVGADKYQSGCLKADRDDKDDGCAIRVVFADNGTLNKINLVCYTGEGSDKELARFKVFVGLREPCISIAQTAEQPYESVGVTNVLWKNDQSASIFQYNTSNTPYGSLGLLNDLSSVDPLVNIFTHYDESTFSPPPAVAGSPYSCAGNCLQTEFGLDETRLDPSVSNKTIDQAKAFFFGTPAHPGIFAKISNLWNWRIQNNKSVYVKEEINSSENNKTETLTNLNNVPRVYPLGNCKSGDKCLEGTAPGLTVNGKSSGDVVFPTEIAKVDLKFYGYANKNQMPIRKIKVNWGDGSVVDLDGYFRNERGAENGVCRTVATGTPSTCYINNAGVLNEQANMFNTKKPCSSQSDCAYLDKCLVENNAPNFGQIFNKTCDNAYFKFDHVYQCVKGDVPGGWKEGAACSNAQMQALYGGCCEFSPAVQLKDNWGWCNGRCVGAPGGEGCYDKRWGNGIDAIDECDPSWSAGASTTFSGKIFVAPN